jgi:hypothetical protein
MTTLANWRELRQFVISNNRTVDDFLTYDGERGAGQP